MTDLPFRIGQAVDVHAFAAPDSPRPLMVACLEWPGERPLEGHSDADVAAHALCDAMLLATGLEAVWGTSLLLPYPLHRPAVALARSTYTPYVRRLSENLGFRLMEEGSAGVFSWQMHQGSAGAL